MSKFGGLEMAKKKPAKKQVQSTKPVTKKSKKRK